MSRLEKVFKLIDAAPKGKKCEAIEGIIEEGAEIMKEFKGRAGSRCRPGLGGPGRRALRDRPLWNPQALGRAARPQ